jgi:DNA-directed RNA polymerase specialized sigma24 family protein
MKDAFRNFNSERRLTAYLATIVQREAKDRRDVLARISAMEPESLERVCDAEYQAESSFEIQEHVEYARHLVRRGLEILRGRIREQKQVDALIMHELEEKNTEETARRNGESVEYVHLACHRGKKRLAEIILELIREEDKGKFCA